ncbi:MAG TPA: hypothetical protein VJX72_05740 [Candidatus Acidoferrum sp.]|nr:hypothetical protein [Candidatus Acidoferrum sp.]
MGNEDNGSGNVRPNGVQRVSVSFNPHTHHADLDLGGLSLDDALSLLERAHRELDARYRFGRARELAAELMNAAATDQLVRNAMRDPRIKT